MKAQAILLLALAPFLTISGFAFSTAAEPEEPDPLLAIAESYLAHLCASDFLALEGLLAEHATFEDPTRVTLTGKPQVCEGRDAMLAFFKRTQNRDTTSSYRLVETFVTGEHVVMRLNYASSGTASMIGEESPPSAGIDIAAVTILQIQEGKVVHHLDHVDYAALLRQATGSR